MSEPAKKTLHELLDQANPISFEAALKTASLDELKVKQNIIGGTVLQRLEFYAGSHLSAAGLAKTDGERTTATKLADRYKDLAEKVTARIAEFEKAAEVAALEVDDIGENLFGDGEVVEAASATIADTAAVEQVAETETSVTKPAAEANDRNPIEGMIIEAPETYLAHESEIPEFLRRDTSIANAPEANSGFTEVPKTPNELTFVQRFKAKVDKFFDGVRNIIESVGEKPKFSESPVRVAVEGNKEEPQEAGFTFPDSALPEVPATIMEEFIDLHSVIKRADIDELRIAYEAGFTYEQLTTYIDGKLPEELAAEMADSYDNLSGVPDVPEQTRKDYINLSEAMENFASILAEERVKLTPAAAVEDTLKDGADNPLNNKSMNNVTEELSQEVAEHKLRSPNDRIDELELEIDDLNYKVNRNAFFGAAGTVVGTGIGIIGGLVAAPEIFPKNDNPAPAVETVDIENVRNATFQILQGVMGDMYQAAGADGVVTDAEIDQIEAAAKVIMLEEGSKGAINRIIEAQAQGK